MATSERLAACPIWRDYCWHVNKIYRTLQLYGVRGDTPVEVDLNRLYVSLTISAPKVSTVRIALEGSKERLRELKLAPEITSENWFGEHEENLSRHPFLFKTWLQHTSSIIEAENLIGKYLPLPSPSLKLDLFEDLLRLYSERLKWEQRQQIATVAETLQNSNRLVVLGAPGSGKTTLLKYLALIFASDQAHEYLQLDEHRLPIFLRFWNYSTSDFGQLGDAVSFLRWIECQIKSNGFAFPDHFLENALEAGECILLLDGLDEVPDQRVRRDTVNAVEAFVNTYPKNRYVVSSRIQGYQGIPHFSSEFIEAYVNEFSDEDIETFVKNWYLAVKGMLLSPLDRQRADDLSEDLRRAVTTNPKVRQLAKNPLLLSTIALVHYNRVRLPERRAMLYDECTAFLLGFWDSSKGIEADAQIQRILGTDFDRNAKRELLEPIAFWFHEQRSENFMVDREVLQSRLAEELGRIMGETNSDKLAEIAGLMLQSARERSGLLIERENGSFAFSHLTFQEYLAARHLAYRPDCIDFVRAHLHESWWQEVILLVSGHLGEENNRWARDLTTRLIEAIRDAGSEYENYLNRDLFFVAKCLVDIGPTGVYGMLRHQIADKLLDIYQNAEFKRLREEAFKCLLRLGSERHNAELRNGLLGLIRVGKRRRNYSVSRLALVRELVELSHHDTQAVEDFYELLSDKDDRIRFAAIRALRQAKVRNERVRNHCTGQKINY